MMARRLTVGLLAVVACSHTPEDAGIVLNIDADVVADRAAINQITVTVDGRRQEWTLAQPLPGSLGIVTRPGSKSVRVDGLASSVPRGIWSGVVVASKGKVVVQDVHLARVESPALDAGTSLADGSRGDAGDPRDSAADNGWGGIDGDRGEAGGTGGGTGQGGTSGRITLPPLPDSGAGGIGGIGGAGGGTSRDAADTASSPDGPSALLSGAFVVGSQFAIAATAATPGPVHNTIALTHGFVEDPGAAILSFADQAGVPAAATLRAVLPSVLQSQLTGWMSSYVKTASVNGVTPYDRLVWLDNTVQSLLLYWGLQSRLALPVDKLGTHTPVTLVFASPSGLPYPVPLEPSASLTAGVGIASTIAWPSGLAGAAVVAVSDHAMAFPFGRYALQALDQMLLAEYGVPDVAAYLSDSVRCPDLAAYVASQCISIFCVGYEAELLAVCQGGLAEGARQIESQMLSIDYKNVRFQQGTATAVGATIARPQDVTALLDGSWSVTVDFGNGPEPATATFTAVVESP